MPLVRITTWMIRFASYVRTHKSNNLQHVHGLLTMRELPNAKIFLLLRAEEVSFKEDICNFK